MEAPAFQPVEMFTCTYNKGKGRKELQRAITRFNEFSDANDPTGYNAWTLTPQYFNADIDWDIAWLGAWTDANEMGASTDTWMSSAGDL